MTKLNYSNYLKKEKFDFEEEYTKIFTSSFEIEKDDEVREEFKNNLGINIFKEQKTVSLYKVFDTYKSKNIEEFNTLFKDKKLEDILTLNSDNMLMTLEKYRDKSDLKKLKYFFNYNKFSKEIRAFFTENFNFRTCFYCNKSFITKFKKNKKEYSSTFQLDHFYDKDKYPYLAISFYNLIPSCTTCNSSTVKGTLDCFNKDNNLEGDYALNEVCTAPNNKNFNFENKVKFKLFLDKDCKNLHVKDKKDIDISLKEQFSDDYNKYIEVFKLNERYQAHKDIVYEMITKAERYPDTRLKELQNLTGIPYQQIKKDIFNLIDENEDLSKKPFSKLIKDISEELKLV